MKSFARHLAAAVAQAGLAALLALALPACAAPPITRAISWDDLRPASVEEVPDPFAGMPDERMDMLRVLVRSRVLEAQGFALTEDARRMRDELARKLALHGVDVDAALARRDAVIAARRPLTSPERREVAAYNRVVSRPTP